MKYLIIISYFLIPTYFYSQSKLFQPRITNNPNDSIVGCIDGEVFHGMKNNVAGLDVRFDVGAALLHNNLSPNFYGGLRFYYNDYQMTFVVQSFYTFIKNGNDGFKSNNHTFLGVDFLKHQHNHINSGFGVSYLVKDEGNNFKKNTFMLWYVYELEYVNLQPSFILTNNFKNAYPSLSISVRIF